jgi:DNA polymerase-3 subunit alpha
VLCQDAVVEIVGRVSSRERDEENPPIFLDSARPLDDAKPDLAVQIELELGSEVVAEAFESARSIIGRHPGASPVWIQVGADNGEPAPRLRSKTLRIDPGAEAVAELQKLFGRGNVRLVRTVTVEAENGFGR